MRNYTVYRKMGVVLPVMAALLLLTIIVAVALGAVYVPLGRSFRIILDNIGIIDDPTLPQEQVSIIYRVRLPRVIVACIAGAALSACGAAMQGLFRNPMADPGVLGVSSGAGLGAMIAITTGVANRSIYTMPVFAAVGALCTVTVIYLLSLRRGRISPLTLILSGIAISTFIGAVTQFILIKSNTYEVRKYVFWTMGALSGMMWEQVRLVTLPVLVLLAALMVFSRDLNLLQFGEEEAQSLGLEPSRTRKLLLLITSLITAVAISVCARQLRRFDCPAHNRLIAGPDHRLLIPASALGGAIFLTGCDIIGRLPAGGEIHVGIITAILGAPYFLYLLIRTRREGGVF